MAKRGQGQPYAIELNKAHGNQLVTSMNPSGVLIDGFEPYQSPFACVSKSLRKLREITQTVAKPKLTEAYQFSYRR